MGNPLTAQDLRTPAAAAAAAERKKTILEKGVRFANNETTKTGLPHAAPPPHAQTTGGGSGVDVPHPPRLTYFKN